MDWNGCEDTVSDVEGAFQRQAVFGYYFLFGGFARIVSSVCLSRLLGSVLLSPSGKHTALRHCECTAGHNPQSNGIRSNALRCGLSHATIAGC